MRFRFGRQGWQPQGDWQEVGVEEGESAEQALERLRAERDLEPGWYRVESASGETGEFLLDPAGITRVM
ncbi:MAG: hypothetical protein U0R71_13110 [Solirubrobacterales bacterium]